MENFVFISPNFPELYYKFCVALKNRGFRVLGIGDAPYDELKPELKATLTEYYCIYQNMEDISKVKDAVAYFVNKYGPIKYLESNNEYWLMHDAEIRKTFNIDTGLYPIDMEKIKKKSAMKACFKEAGVKTARYTIVSDIENSKRFISEVHYPVFVKPNIGVGAEDSYAIHNEEELEAFHKKNLSEEYIMEEYIDGEIISFDGICDDHSEVIKCLTEHFPIPVADVVNENLDDYYYATKDIPTSFKEMGKRTVKAFGIKKRCFHIEYFRLRKNHPGLGNENEIIGLECNMRPPGGNTPDLLSIALGNSFYDVYADVMKWNENRTYIPDESYYAIAVSRKDIYKYAHLEEDIIFKYCLSLVEHGRYAKSIALAMGDLYYYGKFSSLDEVKNFVQYITKKSS